MTRRALMALAFAGVLGLASDGRASCPAFDIEHTKLGFLGLASQRRLTEAEREAILKGGLIPGVPVAVWPPRGPAPLRVGVIWLFEPEDPQAIELDVDGDGKPEVVDTRIENFGHSYTNPGAYAAIVRVRGRDGKVSTYPSPVIVLTPAAFEAELQARWETFKVALRRGDLAAARECVYSWKREGIESDLQELLRPNVEQLLPPIKFVKLELIDALFTSTSPPAGEKRLIEVHFTMDEDGVWRLSRFERAGGRP